MSLNATAAVAGENGEIFELEGYHAVGMAGEYLYPLKDKNTIVLPEYSELMLLPGRSPVVINGDTGEYEILEYNPFNPDEKIFAVSAFNSPGHVMTLNSAYYESENCLPLPLFSYGAVGFIGDDFVSAAYQVDFEERQNLSLMPLDKIEEGLAEKIEKYPKNRLIYHLKKCALQWGCPAAKNFFLSRYEAPLPTSRVCNANCLGCISFQKNKHISSCQNRINFTPSPKEIAEVALSHIEAVEKPVVSFGQGCEGDPLLAGDTILSAVKLIREKTCKGTININTNASLPFMMTRLFDAGVNSIRVSLNSAVKEYYMKYFRPSYKFEDVLETIKTAKDKNIHVSLNYLNIPGFTDTEPEMEALFYLIENYNIDFIQWRNLNYDPKLYLREMNNFADKKLKPFGIISLIELLKKEFISLNHGYFNPPKENFK
ncbi:MAG: radical SAM protein [Deltaproteobacteria bacterium]|nr:MAG: radical SAM protein [Deltaproteobacteria bacterium]PIE75262.1 MAG: radical SAM protein [Deltaproteobacteria bacterium]